MTEGTTEHLRLIRFNFNCGRMGDLHGVFVLDEEEWADWQLLVESKFEVRFGEVLGKHSDIVGPIEASDFEVLTEDQAFCQKFVEFRCGSGHNPLDYLDPEYDDDWKELKNPTPDPEEEDD